MTLSNQESQPFSYYAPTRILVGVNSLEKLASEAAQLGQKALLVTDKGVSAALKLTGRICDSLGQAGLRVSVFEDVPPNPRSGTVREGARLARKCDADVIIALGGGSVLDAAKGIAIVARYGGDIWDYIGDNKVPGRVASLVAVPTTSGTGSETTPFAVFTKKETLRKDGLYSPHIFPAVSILDPLVCQSMPPGLTADTGLDALAHAVEAYTGRSANPIADALAEQAMALVARYLVRAVRKGGDLEARQGMAVASALAGMSITHAGVGAAHGFGMSIGGLFDASHGRTIGVLLPLVMAYNQVTEPEKFARLAKILREGNEDGLFDHATDAASMVALVLRNIGVPDRLGALGITPDDAERIIADCLERGDFRNNPRAFCREEALAFLRTAI